MHKLQSFLLALCLAACSSNRPAPAKPMQANDGCGEPAASGEIATASTGTAGPAQTGTNPDATKPPTKEELDQRERDLGKHHLAGPPIKQCPETASTLPQPTNGPTTPAPAP